MKRKSINLVVPTIYLMTIFVLGTSIFFIKKSLDNRRIQSEQNIDYVDSEIVNDNLYIPVISQDKSMTKPYLIDTVTIINPFYDSKADETTQENAIIIYENTYIQNTGITYQNDSSFDVISVLDGEVIEISKNELLGDTIKIRHNNDLISIYQSISDVSIKEKDQVKRGQTIAKSGTSKIYSEKNNLHFELMYQNNYVNPDEYYNKSYN